MSHKKGKIRSKDLIESEFLKIFPSREKVLDEVIKQLYLNMSGYDNLDIALHEAKYTSSFSDMERDVDAGREWCRVFIKWINDMKGAR